MDEKKMPLDELIGWLNSNNVSYEIDDAGELTAKGSLHGHFRHWVGTCEYTGLPDEFVRVNGSLWLAQAPIVSLGGLTSLGGSLDLKETSITSLGNLISVGGDLTFWGTPLTSLGNLTSVGGTLNLNSTPLTSLDNLPQVGGDLHLDQSQFQLLTREALQKVKGKIRYRDQATEEWWPTWVALSSDELEAIIAENERRESLHSVRESDVNWDLYDR